MRYCAATEELSPLQDALCHSSKCLNRGRSAFAQVRFRFKQKLAVSEGRNEAMDRVLQQPKRGKTAKASGARTTLEDLQVEPR